MKPNHYFILYTTINSKQIKALHERPETIKLLEENIGGELHDIGLVDDFVNLKPKAKAGKTINRWE